MNRRDLRNADAEYRRTALSGSLRRPIQPRKRDSDALTMAVILAHILIATAGALHMLRVML